MKDKGQFKKGSVPWNKGLKGYMGANRTSFKKGNTPPQHRQVGSERVSKDGYTYVKVAEPSLWKLKHRYIYEQHHGEIDKNVIISFADGDKQNFNIDNLILMTRSENVQMNQDKRYSENADITKTNLTVVKIKNKVKELMK